MYFLLCRYGVETQCDMKASPFSVKGFHEAATLQNILDDFIKEFVLCNVCTNPETP